MRAPPDADIAATSVAKDSACSGFVEIAKVAEGSKADHIALRSSGRPVSTRSE